MGWRTGGLLVLAFGLLAPASSAGGDDAISQAIDHELPARMARYDVPGAAVALVRDGESVWSGAYGYADVKDSRRVTDETRFEAGSIAKPLTAWGIMVLVEDGRLNLDDPAVDHLPDDVAARLDSVEYDPREVTVEMLLSNSSGLPASIGIPGPDGFRSGEVDADALRLGRRPGEQFVYSNPGFVLAALIIEEVSGQAYAGFMEERVLEPLGMHDSGFGAQPRFEGRAATGYTFDGEPVAWREHGPLGAGGLYSTAEDLARFVAATVSYGGGEAEGAGWGGGSAPAVGGGAGRAGGQEAGASEEAAAARIDAEPEFGARLPLSVESIKQLHTPCVPVSGAYHSLMSDSYALGHFVETLSDGQPLLTHGGESGGWMAAFFALPESGEGIVLLTNSRRSWALMELVGLWTEELGIGAPVMSQSFARLRAGVVAITVLAGALAVGLLIAVGLQWSRGTRRPALFIQRALVERRGTPGSRRALASGRAVPGPRRALVLRGILLLLAVALAAGWWFLVHGIVAMFFPVLVGYPAVAVSLLAVTLFVMSGTVRVGAGRLLSSYE